jgi:hypothetical protein
VVELELGVELDDPVDGAEVDGDAALEGELPEDPAVAPDPAAAVEVAGSAAFLSDATPFFRASDG